MASKGGQAGGAWGLPPTPSRATSPAWQLTGSSLALDWARLGRSRGCWDQAHTWSARAFSSAQMHSADAYRTFRTGAEAHRGALAAWGKLGMSSAARYARCHLLLPYSGLTPSAAPTSRQKWKLRYTTEHMCQKQMLH